MSPLLSNTKALKTRLTRCFSPGEIATDAEAATLQKKVWTDTIAVLKAIKPDVATELLTRRIETLWSDEVSLFRILPHIS